jgi:GNAT superfamily N-acetyltransferase
MFREWRLVAAGIKVGAPLEPWWSEADAPEPVIGRCRVKRGGRGIDTDLGDLAALAGEMLSRPGVTEILNVELQPAFLGQGLGIVMLRAALADVPDDDIVVCQPTPTEYSNVPPGRSAAAVAAFYHRLGFAVDDRLPRYLTARRANLLL